MIIDRVEAIPLRIPFKPGVQAADAAWGSKGQPAADSLIVKVTTSDGLIGWGETFGFGVVPAAKAAIDTMIAPLCIGQDAGRIAPLMLDVQRKLHIFGRSGPVMYGISALDIALWDLAGKAAKLPVHRLLGGARDDRVPAYASLMRFSDPDLVRSNVRGAIGQGFRHLKLHEIDLPAIRAAREEAGSEVELMLDVNCPWDLAQAKVRTAALREVKPRWLEEPIWPPEDFAALAELRRSTDVPIATGENASTLVEFDRMLAAGAVDVIQPSPAKMGGLTELAKVAALAGARNVTLMVHTFYDGPGLLAAIHATAALGRADGMLEWRAFDLEASPYGERLQPRDGHVTVPQAPGLGLEPDETVIRDYAVKP
jgi:L-alanine-DL-glutamate epimerase-like enolase superfamily enzyme